MPQHVLPIAHEGTQAGVTHIPRSQTWPSSHALPHSPQFIASDWTSTHPLPQQACPGGHAGDSPQRQTPAMHISPSAHAGEHGGKPQLPALQLSPSSQRIPHAPQLDESVCRSTHRPSQHTPPSVHAAPAPQ